MMWMRYSRFASQPMRTQSLYDDENIKSFSELQWSYIMTAAEKWRMSNRNSMSGRYFS